MWFVTLSKRKAIILGASAVVSAGLVLIATGFFGRGADRTDVAGNQATQSAPAPAPARAGGTHTPTPTPTATSDAPSAQSSTATFSNGSKGGKPGPGGQGGGSVTNGAFEIKGSVTGLFPGADLPLPLKLENPTNTAIRVTSLTVAAAHSDKAGCDGANLTLPRYTDAEGSDDDIVVPGRGERFETMTIGLVADSADACQGATWNLTYTGRAVKA